MENLRNYILRPAIRRTIRIELSLADQLKPFEAFMIRNGTLYISVTYTLWYCSLKSKPLLTKQEESVVRSYPKSSFDGYHNPLKECQIIPWS